MQSEKLQITDDERKQVIQTINSYSHPTNEVAKYVNDDIDTVKAKALLSILPPEEHCIAKIVNDLSKFTEYFFATSMRYDTEKTKTLLNKIYNVIINSDEVYQKYLTKCLSSDSNKHFISQNATPSIYCSFKKWLNISKCENLIKEFQDSYSQFEFNKIVKTIFLSGGEATRNIVLQRLRKIIRSYNGHKNNSSVEEDYQECITNYPGLQNLSIITIYLTCEEYKQNNEKWDEFKFNKLSLETHQNVAILQNNIEYIMSISFN